MATSSPGKYTAYIGMDWADTKHDICLQAAGSTDLEFDCIPHRVDAIEQWAHELHSRFGGPIAVALELSRGPIVYALQKYDFLVLFPINPMTLAKYRQAFRPSRAKDDPSDAELALDLIIRHPERFKPLQPQSGQLRELLYLVEQRRQLVDDRVRLSNRLTNALKHYYPQPLEWFQEHDTQLFLDFLGRWPTLTQAKRARKSTLEKFFYDHRSRRRKVIEKRIGAIKAAIPLTEDPAVLRGHRLLVEALIEQLNALLQAIERYDSAISSLAIQHPDYQLFASLPGAGAALAPRLLVAFGDQRDRFASAEEVQMFTGIAPVIERSGKKTWVHWRMQCPTFLRQTFVEWAGCTLGRSYWAGMYYQQQRAKGQSHHTAIRALAFKWIRILYRCWKDRVPYDESTYLRALRRRGSPLIAEQSA
jgi:transposase